MTIWEWKFQTATPPTVFIRSQPNFMRTLFTMMAKYRLQWSLHFKTTHGTKKMWSYIAGGLKRKVI